MATVVMVMTKEPVTNLQELANLDNKKKIVCFDDIGKLDEWALFEMKSVVETAANHLIYRFMHKKW